jgi:hypothetical protein
MEIVVILAVIGAIAIAVVLFKGGGVASYMNAVSAELIKLGAYPMTVKAVWTLDGVHDIVYKCRTQGVAPSACAAMIDQYTAGLSQEVIQAAIAKVMPIR